MNCKTTDNYSVNIYILNQIEEILLYSIIMDVTTTVNPKENKKDKKENNQNEAAEENIKKVSNDIEREKDQILFEHNELRELLEIIKNMITQYENKFPKSKMILFQNMLIEHKKDLHVLERKEATSIIYYIL